MKKTIFKLFLTTTCLFAAAPSHNINNNIDTISLQHLGETNTDVLFDSLANKQTPLVQTDYYSNYYFMNLRNNIGNNVYGSCTYVAMGMLLSFYDSYWDDSFIPEAYDTTTEFQPIRQSGTDFDLIPLDTESPGISFESNELVNNLPINQYMEVVNQNSDKYFQFKLIKLAKQYFGDEKFDTSLQPLGMNYNELQNFLSYYLYTFNQKSNSDVFINSAIGSSETVKSFTKTKLLSGTPILLRAKNSNADTGHAMIAYDYDSKTGEIYVHTGWKDESKKIALTHVSLSDLGYDVLCDATAIETNYDYIFSKNYITTSGVSIASSNYFLPQDIQLVSGNYRDTLPKFTWEGLFKEKWVSEKNPYYKLSILKSNDVQLFQISDIDKKECSLTQEQWNYLLFTDTNSSYQIYVEMSSDLYPYWDDYWTIKSFKKPRTYDNLPSVAPVEYGFPDAYSVDSGVASQYSSHTTNSGFTFQTRRYRTGYIHDEYIVMSPIRTGYNEAFIEYKFNTPVERIDVELSHWRSASMEGLTSSTGIAGIDEFWGNTYTKKLDLLSSSTDLPTNRTYPTVYKIMFEHPVYQIKFYAETFNKITSASNKGRICIGNMAFYVAEDGMPLSGYELDYEPDIWNKNSTIKEQTNCYAYALNVKYNPLPHNPYISTMQPGQSRGNNYSISTEDIPNISKLISDIQHDADYYQFAFLPIGQYEQCSQGTYKVALVVDDEDYSSSSKVDFDYHWYRQNSDGTWSHKPGTTDVCNTDYSNEVIIDPMYCNRNYNDVLNYKIFVGYFAVSQFI